MRYIIVALVVLLYLMPLTMYSQKVDMISMDRIKQCILADNINNILSKQEIIDFMNTDLSSQITTFDTNLYWPLTFYLIKKPVIFFDSTAVSLDSTVRITKFMSADTGAYSLYVFCKFPTSEIYLLRGAILNDVISCCRRYFALAPADLLKRKDIIQFCSDLSFQWLDKRYLMNILLNVNKQ